MKKSILLALNDSMSSRRVLDYLIGFFSNPSETYLTLLHVFRKPTASEELMGEKFMRNQHQRFLKFLEKTKENLVQQGYHSKQIEIRLVTEPYPTIADGIIDQFEKGDYNMVMIGRKRMSRTEEFVLGDVGVKLVRALEGTAILVVKS
jgi:nucleotide-binding universal stress UspA family protein